MTPHDHARREAAFHARRALRCAWRHAELMKFPRKAEPHEEELAALVDESLPAARAERVEARVSESPELAERLAEQRRALALVRGAAVDVEAPARLRARIEEERRREAARGCDRVRSRSPRASQSPPPLRSCSRSRFRAAQEGPVSRTPPSWRRCRPAAPRRRSPRTRPSSWTRRSGRFRSRTGSRSSAARDRRPDGHRRRPQHRDGLLREGRTPDRLHDRLRRAARGPGRRGSLQARGRRARCARPRRPPGRHLEAGRTDLHPVRRRRSRDAAEAGRLERPGRGAF